MSYKRIETMNERDILVEILKELEKQTELLGEIKEGLKRSVVNIDNL